MASGTVAVAPALRTARTASLQAGLGVVLFGALLLGLGLGPVRISPLDSIAVILGHLGVHTGRHVDEQQDAILWVIRMPRVLLGALVGGGLAISGAGLQAMLRNPLADPGLIGVSSGASVGAVGVIALGAAAVFPGALQLAAFLGAAAAAAAVYLLSRQDGRTEPITLILTGIAVTATCGSIIGLLIARADDSRLRDAVFWSLGSVGGATWSTLRWTAPCVLIGALVVLRLAPTLDLITLGDSEARHLGVDTERIRLQLVGAVSLAAGAAVAAAGIVAFVGLVVPHLIRLGAGPGHRRLLPASFLAGAALTVLADLAARTITAPTELPLGVVTSLAGGPFFLWLIRHSRKGNRFGP